MRFASPSTYPCESVGNVFRFRISLSHLPSLRACFTGCFVFLDSTNSESLSWPNISNVNNSDKVLLLLLTWNVNWWSFFVENQHAMLELFCSHLQNMMTRGVLDELSHNYWLSKSGQNSRKYSWEGGYKKRHDSGNMLKLARLLEFRV